ncbi:hypothetical protein IC762_05670 [Bradyrhizobium genosp. L]|uniref:hypothetical protein n=1 Tax=Bradyrhizobium genosp. L TaxID=83637 RepID=UPI0018A2D9DF|nr:hypothetical protein [Bradyrhizobium genosp. L]QPF85796.1 hypothetical protein IC762_05670 [Bradyrhizobium genosp. L]
MTARHQAVNLNPFVDGAADKNESASIIAHMIKRTDGMPKRKKGRLNEQAAQV